VSERKRLVRLIVGLGNPGTQYDWTPHNLGFMVIDALAERHSIRVTRPEAKALVGLGTIAGHDVILVKPQTFMNLSGGSVRPLLEKYEALAPETIVLSDDVALPFAKLRIRERGSAGGHNGLKSIISSLGSQDFIRVRLGCAPEHPLGDMADFVLAPIRKPDREAALQMVSDAAKAVELIVSDGVQKAMGQFNRRADSEDEVSD
jgi:peptidyl-tRNA hydrolase, PTH1 family